MNDYATPKKDRRTSRSALPLWIISTLLLTAVIHLLVVFALPSIGRAVLVDQAMPPYEAGPRLYASSSGETVAPFRYADKRTDSVFCSFDLRDGAIRVGGELDVPFWSISVHTLSGLVVGSVNHRAAVGGGLDLLVMRPALARDLAAAGAQLPSDALVVEMEGPLGLVRISGLASYEALRPALRAELERMECTLATFSFATRNEDDAAGPDGDTPGQGNDQPSVPAPVPRPEQSE